MVSPEPRSHRMREVDQRFGIIERGCSHLVDDRSASHKKHTLEQMIRQRVYQKAAGYEDCNEADDLRMDPAMRLALGKGHQFDAIKSVEPWLMGKGLD